MAQKEKKGKEIMNDGNLGARMEHTGLFVSLACPSYRLPRKDQKRRKDGAISLSRGNFFVWAAM